MVCRPVPIDLDFWLLAARLCHNILLKSNRGFPPAMSAKISFKMTLSFPQPQRLCHRIYNSCFDYLPWPFSLAYKFLLASPTSHLSKVSNHFPGALQRNSGEFLFSLHVAHSRVISVMQKNARLILIGG